MRTMSHEFDTNAQAHINALSIAFANRDAGKIEHHLHALESLKNQLTGYSSISKIAVVDVEQFYVTKKTKK